jgi:nitrous oxidase accessory protein NosD
MSDVIGQDNATVDAPAVQQAVDAGGTVVLHGTFNFVNVRLPAPLGSRVILVTRAVTIRGENATILGGGSAAPGGLQTVFFIDAPGADVTIEGLRFVNPHNAAIRVARSGDLRIAKCQVEGMTPSKVATPGGVQNAALAIHLPGGSVGAVSILKNRFQIGGTADDSIGGIIMTGPSKGLLIADNRISGTTSHGIDLRDIKGSARVERNIVETGTVGRSGLPGQFVDALRLIGSGEYLVQRNQFDCGFENAAVVRLGATKKAVIRQNDVVASVPKGRLPGLQSAGVQVQGSAKANEILKNRIAGRGRVAISVIFSDFPLDKPSGTDGNPSATTFQGNNVQHFAPTLATVEVGAGAKNTTIKGGSGTIIDNGIGTVVDGKFHPPS